MNTEFPHKLNQLKPTAVMPFSISFLTILLFTMWDIYLVQIGLRVLDFIALGVLFFWLFWNLLSNMGRITFQSGKIITPILLSVFTILWGLVGIISSVENIKPIMGFALGVGIYFFYYSVMLDRYSLDKVFNIIIIIHACYLILQFIFYYATGIMLNFFAFMGTLEPRAISSIFRPTGLYLEPSAYSVSILMLLTAKFLISKSFDKVTIFALATIFLTLSFWGIVAGFIFIICFSKKNLKFIITLILLICAIVFTIFFIDNPFLISHDTPWMRLQNLSDDSSLYARFGGLIDFADGGSQFDTVHLLFGSGINNDYLDFGSSGIGFLINATGIVGLFLFLFIISLDVPRGKKFVTIGFIILFMIAAPIFTTLFWWLFLALITRPLIEKA